MTMLLRELNDPRTELYPIKVNQYHRMIKQGIIEEGAPFELLNGAIVRKDRSAQGENPMTVGNEHIYTLMVMQDLAPRLRRRGCHIRLQQPILIPPVNEPEPDGAIVHGTMDDYAERLPQAKDILCVIEVSDASLRRDRTTKQEIYSRAGINRYFIVNLQERVVEKYSHPIRRRGIYGMAEVLRPSQKIALPTAKGTALVLQVRDLFPRVSPQTKKRRSAS